MARTIDVDNLTPHDKVYLEQRPWLIGEIEMETGKSFDELDFGIDASESKGEGDENATLSVEQELAAVRRQNAKLTEENEDLRDKLASMNEALEKMRVDSGSEPDEEVDPYEDWDYDVLVDELKKRNDAREEAGQEPLKVESRKGKDIIAALEADDAEAELAEKADEDE